MKKFNFLKTMLLAVVLLVGSASAWAQTYTLVTTAPSDWSGEYLIVAGTSALSGGTSSWGTFESITVAGNDIITTKNISVTITTGGTTGTYYIYQNSNSTYLKEVTSNTFATSTSANTDTEWVISLNGNGEALIGCASGSTRVLRLNGTSGFRAYTSATGTLPKLYKLQESSCTPADYLFDSNNVSKSTTDAPFTNDFISDNTSPVVWSSSNTDVATVDAGTGEVTIVGAGTAEIEITQVADDTYCAVNANYTLNVVSTTPTITVSPASLSFSGIVVGGTPGEDLVEVTGANLTENITAVISGDNAAMFAIDETTITVTGGAANAAPIITYTPTAAGTHTATLTLSSAGAADKTVALSGTAALVTPVATAASSIGNFGFTANWEAVPGAESYVLDVYTKEGGEAPELVSNGGFENWTSDKPDSWFGSKTNIATGSVSQYTTSVRGGSSAVQLKETGTNHKRFTTATVNVVNETEYTINFWVRGNGDIRTALFDDRTADSGYSKYNAYISVNSTDWTEYTQTVTAANTTDKAEFIFSVRNTVADKDHIQIDDVSITYVSETLTPISGSPFTVVAPSVSRAITGLTNDKMYFYTVKAVDGSFESALSNEVGPIELTSTGVNNATALSGIAIQNGNLLVSATAGTLIEVYNIAGQKIVSQTAKEGVNTIAIAQRGAMIVKIGTETVKVVI